MATIPFNKPYMTGKELGYIAQAHAHGQLAGLFEDAQRREDINGTGGWIWKRQQ